MFHLSTKLKPAGDQHLAIDKLSRWIQKGVRHQTLLGVTGSGKTFTASNVIAKVGKPVLVLSPNKALAAQLYSELKAFFPKNAVEYFVSYFDYYQPEAYVAHTDTYIDKDASINEGIERLRLSTMRSLLSRNDVIVVASVSCIYGLGSPSDWQEMSLEIQEGQEILREDFIHHLVRLGYSRDDINFGAKGTFRVRGEVINIMVSGMVNCHLRVDFFDSEIEKIQLVEDVSAKILESLEKFRIFPSAQFASPREKLKPAIKEIQKELKERIHWFEKRDKLAEAQRIKLRTEYDLEMMQELGFCKGIENYSRYLSGRKEGEAPWTLLDFFPEDFLMILDESHIAIPQLVAMYSGDRSRKISLVEHGFRLPSALDNRPLQFEELMKKTKQFLYLSATPSSFELVNSSVSNQTFISPQVSKEIFNESFKRDSQSSIAEQILRPTGLLDPMITCFPAEGQIDKVLELCRQRVERKDRVLITALTKRTAEDLSDYLAEAGFKSAYLHSDIDTIERIEILRNLRLGKYEVLVGINLLREGLDLPEVSLVCVLDADQEGFLRNVSSLIQVAGRAARHENGECALFFDRETDSIRRFRFISEERRKAQQEYNLKNQITPKRVIRSTQQSLKEKEEVYSAGDDRAKIEQEMFLAAEKLDFEKAADLKEILENFDNS